MAAIISELTGIEPGEIRLLVSLIAAVLFAYPYKLLAERLPPTLQHMFNILTGIGLMYYCFGLTIKFVLFDICTIAVLLKVAGGTLTSVLITIAVVFGHLLWGYYLEYLSGGRQLTNWLLPQCVLTLKLIGLATSLYDAKRGRKSERKSRGDREFILETHRVDVLEVVGFCCLFSTCIVGPQISFRRYIQFVNGTLYDRRVAVGNIRYAMTRVVLAALYGVFYLTLSHIIPASGYLLTPAFARENFATKILMSAIPFYVLFKRYTIGWLLVESSCVLMGLSYNEKENGSYDWTGCICIDLWKWETLTSIKAMITAINISVNKWLIYYIFKRLKFLNSLPLQQLVVTLFTCVWHSLFPGVYLAFLNGIPMDMFLQNFFKVLKIYSKEADDWPVLVRIISKICFNIFLNIRVGFFFIPFAFPKPSEFLIYWGAVHYFGLYLISAELILYFAMNILIQRSKFKETKTE